MGTKDPRVDAYIERSAEFAQPLLTHLRALVHKAVPDVEETLKWGMPHFEHQGTVCSIAAFKAHAVLGFPKQQLLKSLAGHTDGRDEAMGSFGRITSRRDLPSDKVLLAAMREAASLNAQGIKAPRTKTGLPKPTVRVPPALKEALDAHASAREHFARFTPGKRRDYVEWIAEAKTDATRQRRIATAVEWIAEGRSRNWKYEP